MKSHFSRVVALGVLVCASLPSWAQIQLPPEQASVGHRFDSPSADALAMLGAFHNKMRHAGSYRGQVTSTLTSFSQGWIVSKIRFDIQSSWIRDEKREGAISRSVVNSTTTTSPGRASGTGKTIIYVNKDVNDGRKHYYLDVSRKTWQEVSQSLDSTPFPLFLMKQAWISALASVRKGRELTVERQSVNGQEQVLVKDGLIKQWILDAKTGDLIFFTESEGGETTETRWLNNEFDVKLPDSTFIWEVPQGVKQIVPPNPVFSESKAK